VATATNERLGEVSRRIARLGVEGQHGTAEDWYEQKTRVLAERDELNSKAEAAWRD
jgi:hypothetical protein